MTTITVGRWSVHGGSFEVEGDSIESAICDNWDKIIDGRKPGGAAGYHLDAVYVEVSADHWQRGRDAACWVSQQMPAGATGRLGTLVIESHGLPLAHEGNLMRPKPPIRIGVVVPVDTPPGRHDIELRAN